GHSAKILAATSFKMLPSLRKERVAGHRTEKAGCALETTNTATTSAVRIAGAGPSPRHQRSIREHAHDSAGRAGLDSELSTLDHRDRRGALDLNVLKHP